MNIMLERLQSLPDPFKAKIAKAVETLLSKRYEIKAIIVIGSVAIGDYQPDSDIDIVCVVKGPISYNVWEELHGGIPEGVQLVVMTEESLNKPFETSNTMAYAIKNGTVLWQEDDFLSPFFERLLTRPDPQWMKGWFLHWLKFYSMGMKDLEWAKGFHQKFCQEECHCSLSDNLARATVNFAILYCETQDVVPITKTQIFKSCQDLLPSQLLLDGLKTALLIAHEDREMTFSEAEGILKICEWLKEHLMGLLRVEEKDMEEIERFREIIFHQLSLRCRGDRPVAPTEIAGNYGHISTS